MIRGAIWKSFRRSLRAEMLSVLSVPSVRSGYHLGTLAFGVSLKKSAQLPCVHVTLSRSLHPRPGAVHKVEDVR